MSSHCSQYLIVIQSDICYMLILWLFFSIITSSVSDPHSLYADPNPDFCVNADPDPYAEYRSGSVFRIRIWICIPNIDPDPGANRMQFQWWSKVYQKALNVFGAQITDTVKFHGCVERTSFILENETYNTGTLSRRKFLDFKKI
jgi:hypothetical protein